MIFFARDYNDLSNTTGLSQLTLLVLVPGFQYLTWLITIRQGSPAPLKLLVTISYLKHLAELVDGLLFVTALRKTLHLSNQWFYLLINGILLQISRLIIIIWLIITCVCITPCTPHCGCFHQLQCKYKVQHTSRFIYIWQCWCRPKDSLSECENPNNESEHTIDGGHPPSRGVETPTSRHSWVIRLCRVSRWWWRLWRFHHWLINSNDSNEYHK